MSERRDASMAMARKGRMPFRTDDKTEVLRRLQGTVHFEKTLSATNVSPTLRRCMMGLPAWFVREDGDKFRRPVILRSESSTKSWTVKLAITCKNSANTQVRFSGGLKAFATFHGLQVEDLLVFSLTAISEFHVYIFPRTRKPKRCRSEWAPREWPDGSEPLRKKAKQEPYENKDEQVVDEGGIGGIVTSNGVFPKKRTVGKEEAVSSTGHSSTSCSISSNRDLDSHSFESENVREPALDPVELTVSGDIKNGPAKQTGARKNTENVYQDLALQMITRLLAFPGFLKELTLSNICRHGGVGETASMLLIPCMRLREELGNARIVFEDYSSKFVMQDVPLYFWKAYGRRLHSVVKLQGIHDESEVRTMPCLPNHGKLTRLYLKAEWRDFANENNLKVGQELLFALTADSFFIVREMLPPSRDMSRE